MSGEDRHTSDTFERKEYCVEFLEKLYQSRRLTADVHFIPANAADENDCFPANKLILATGCPYFQELFYPEIKPEPEVTDVVMIPIDQQILTVQSPSKFNILIDKIILELILKYIYLNQYAINLEILEALMDASVLLKLDKLTQKCRNFLHDQGVNKETWSFHFRLTNENKDEEMLKMVYQFLKTISPEILDTPGFVNLKFRELKMLVDAGVWANPTDLQLAKFKWFAHENHLKIPHMEDLAKLDLPKVDLTSNPQDKSNENPHPQNLPIDNPVSIQPVNPPKDNGQSQSHPQQSSKSPPMGLEISNQTVQTKEDEGRLGGVDYEAESSNRNPLHANHLHSDFFKRIKKSYRVLGHKSSIYCVLFDNTGRYIITGADDTLVKIWSAIDGRLLATLRGASEEIADLAINNENTLLAVGSCDKIIRIWALSTCSPIAILQGQGGHVTSIFFCPMPKTATPHGLRYLASTSSDGSCAVWAYTEEGGKIEFQPKPTLYLERMRPGHAQIICSSFSSGGLFMAAGSADNNVRVYHMIGNYGPERVLEVECHTDRVDSISWAHKGLRFISGSKDGTALIWRYEYQQWRYLRIHCTKQLPGEVPIAENPKLRPSVTMVSWNTDDTLVICAVSNHLVKVWNPQNGALIRVLASHQDEAFIIEPHPKFPSIICTAGHDGKLIIWDIGSLTKSPNPSENPADPYSKGTILMEYFNELSQGQGHGSIFDAKWSHDGLSLVATDSHGHVIQFGDAEDKKYEKLPPELFFHTDYHPLTRDAITHTVVDEQTQVEPHLMPPPFLVDMEGNPYPPEFQRLVPDRENCSDEQLILNVAIEHGRMEMIDKTLVVQSMSEETLAEVEKFRQNHFAVESSYYDYHSTNVNPAFTAANPQSSPIASEKEGVRSRRLRRLAALQKAQATRNENVNLSVEGVALPNPPKQERSYVQNSPSRRPTQDHKNDVEAIPSESDTDSDVSYPSSSPSSSSESSESDWGQDRSRGSQSRDRLERSRKSMCTRSGNKQNSSLIKEEGSFVNSDESKNKKLRLGPSTGAKKAPSGKTKIAPSKGVKRNGNDKKSVPTQGSSNGSGRKVLKRKMSTTKLNSANQGSSRGLKNCSGDHTKRSESTKSKSPSNLPSIGGIQMGGSIRPTTNTPFQIPKKIPPKSPVPSRDESARIRNQQNAGSASKLNSASQGSSRGLKNSGGDHTKRSGSTKSPSNLSSIGGIQMGGSIRPTTNTSFQIPKKIPPKSPVPSRDESSRIRNQQNAGSAWLQSRGICGICKLTSLHIIPNPANPARFICGICGFLRNLF